MKNICILYSTVDGQTKKISYFLENEFRQKDASISVYSLSSFDKEISAFDTIIIGASIRYGKHNEEVYAFIEEHKKELEKVSTAFFSVNLVARKAGKDTAETNPYVIKFIDSITCKLNLIDVFAGCLDYSKYGFFDRLMIKAIMMFTHGPTSTKEPIEYTEWDRVRSFGEKAMQLEQELKRDIPKEATTF